MNTASQYWKLIKLTASGRSQMQELPEVRSFLSELFPGLVEMANLPIQQRLMAIARPSGISRNTQAELSLRCFISKQIEMTCVQLEMQFGELHGVRRSELLPLVLDDDGRVWSEIPTETGYRSVARQILDTFDPDRASLATWTIRLVKHHRELNAFLLE